MATFKVGQRVRIVGATKHPHMIGRQAIVTRGLEIDPLSQYNRESYEIEVPGHPHPIHGRWNALPEHLAPLTDPKADAFIERVKSWKPEPVMPAPNRITTG